MRWLCDLREGTSPQRAHPSCRLRLLFIKSWFSSQPEDALINPHTQHCSLGWMNPSRGQSASIWDLGVSRGRTYCLWSPIWPANLGLWGQARSALGVRSPIQGCQSQSCWREVPRTRRGAPRRIFLPILWNDLALAGNVHHYFGAFGGPVTTRRCLQTLTVSFRQATTQACFPAFPHLSKLGRPFAARDGSTHSLRVHEECRAFGAGGEHLRRADKLGPDSPEIVPKVTGSITG